MEQIRYRDFELAIRPSGDGFEAHVYASPAGEARHLFELPFSDDKLENLILKMGHKRGVARSLGSREIDAARELGGALFSSVFGGEVLSTLRGSLNEVRKTEGTGLRIKLRLQDVPHLADIPWEFLHDAKLDRFLAQSNRTPIVRYLEIPEPIAPLRITPPLRILVMASNPKNVPQLDTEREHELLLDAVAPLMARGAIEIEWQEKATMATLQRSLRPERSFHVFHFIGHGIFSPTSGEGKLVMESDNGDPFYVGAHRVATLLGDHPSLRLAVFNSCEGARSSRIDPFSSLATTVIQQSVPAAVAMQFEISDRAALTFTGELYSALAVGMPVDAAVAEARKAIYGQKNDVEWGTPVLYMRAPDGVLFVIEPVDLPAGVAPPLAAEGEAPAPAVEPDAVAPPPSPPAADPPEPERDPWTWPQALMALLVVLNLAALAWYFWSIPEAHFGNLGKVLSTLGGWLAAVAGIFGLKLRSHRKVPLRQVLVMKPLILCVGVSTVLLGYLVLPFHAVSLNVTDAESGEPVAGVKVRVDSEDEPRATLSDAEGRIRVRGLPATSHTFELTKRGFEPEGVSTSFVDALAFGSRRSRVVLEPQRAEVLFESEPAGAEVFFDGGEEPLGVTPLTRDLPVGTYVFYMRKDGWAESDRQRIEVTARENGDPVPSYQVALQRPWSGIEGSTSRESEQPVARYLVSILSKPHLAQILVDGESRGTTPNSFRLAQGKHEVQLRLRGYRTVETTIEVPDQPGLEVTLEPLGKEDG